MAYYQQQSLKRVDTQMLIGIILFISSLGLVAIYSSSSIYALEKFADPLYFVKKQFFGLLLGCFAFLIARFMPLSLIRALSPLLFIGSIMLTALTLLPGWAITLHGSSRWLSLQWFTFQPSELLKLSLIMYISHLLASKEHSLKIGNTKIFFTIIGSILLTAMVLLKQPDFGMAVTLTITALILLFIMQVKTKHLVLTLCAFVPTMLLLVMLKPYRLQRIITFLNPWKDPQGAGFQIIQSLIAIGSGGWWGLGIGQSKQKFFYLPMQHTDFIFSIIVEESGMIGALCLIGLYTALLYYGFKRAHQQKDNFATIFTLGFMIVIALQTIIHLGVTTGLVPPKGVGLPLMSYGKSSLITIYAMIGFIINGAYNKS